MRSLREIKEHYNFTGEDEKNLIALRPLMESKVEKVMESLHFWIMNTRETSSYFTEESSKVHVFTELKRWFLDLFSGQYDNKYYERLIRIGTVHVKRGVDAHYVNRAINIVRNSCIEIIHEINEPAEDIIKKTISFEKILDINLDIITSSYIEEEIKSYSPVYKVKTTLIDLTEKFSQAMNLVLIIALIGLTLGVVALFIQDIKSLFSGKLTHGIISALGSMLIFWVMIELINTEISHLKGGKFHISVFVGVALVTIIRETMIATLRHEKPETIYYLIAAILVIGFIYYLVVKAEERLR